jgi:integrase
MPVLKRNAKVIESALKGEPALYKIEGVPALHLSVLGNGRASWRLRYILRKGHKRKWHTIGKANDIELSEAMKTARDLMAKLQLEGKDPRESQRPALPPVSKTISAIYDHWLANPGRKRALRNRTREEYDRIFRLHVKPYIGDVAIDALTKSEISDALERVRITTTDPERGFRGTQATKALKLIYSLGEYAVDKNVALRNPARGIDPPVPERNPQGKQHRPPTDDELRKIWNEAPGYINGQSVRVLRLAIILGKRVSELVEAKKSELHLTDEPHWLIPSSRTGNKGREDQIVPLPKMAISIFKEACEASGSSPYIFQARGDDEKPISRHTPSQAFTEFRRKIGIEDKVRFHDARGLIIDQMSKLKIPREYRSHILHHTSDMRGTLAEEVYSTYDYFEEKQRALRLWSIRLQEIVRGRRRRALRW